MKINYVWRMVHKQLRCCTTSPKENEFVEGTIDEICFCLDVLGPEGMLQKLAQHHIELDMLISLADQAMYKMNPKYVTTIKQDVSKLLIIGFLQHVKEAT